MLLLRDVEVFPSFSFSRAHPGGCLDTSLPHPKHRRATSRRRKVSEMNCALLALALVGRVADQLNAGVPGSSAGNSAFGGSALCNKTFADANAVRSRSVSK